MNHKLLHTPYATCQSKNLIIIQKCKTYYLLINNLKSRNNYYMNVHLVQLTCPNNYQLQLHPLFLHQVALLFIADWIFHPALQLIYHEIHIQENPLGLVKKTLKNLKISSHKNLFTPDLKKRYMSQVMVNGLQSQGKTVNVI